MNTHNIFKSVLFSTLLLIGNSCSDRKGIDVIPMPRSVEYHSGNFTISPETKFYTNLSAESRQALTDYLEGTSLGSVPFAESATGNNGIELNLWDSSIVTGNEAYRIEIDKKGVRLSANTETGIFYGLQTLLQLLNNGDNKTLPALTINDSPRFPYRGLHLDVSRHFFDKEFVKKQLNAMAYFKMNRLHWHLTDGAGWRIEIKKYPKLTEIGSKREKTLVDYYYVNYPQVFDGEEHEGYYTQEQIKDVVAYAASKYINVVPEIEMPGHALAALASYPELSFDSTQTYKVSPTWGVFEQVFCPSETTFKFFEGVMDEVVELFPSEYIHIGGDECPKTAWKNSAFCQQLIRQLGLKDDVTPSKVDGVKHSKEDKLQSYFVTRMEKYLNDKGRNIIGWDEILEGGLAPNATVMSWRGVEGGLNAAKAGHNAIMTPMPYAYLDFYQEDPAIAPTTIGGYTTLKKTYSYNPAPDDADELVKKHVIGMQGNIWREYMKNSDRTDYQAFPRAMAIAETGWTLDANIMAGRD